MSDRAFGDTNLFVYASDAGEPAKRAVAREVIAGCRSGDLVLSAQVLGEFYTVVTRRLAVPLGPAEASRAVQGLSRLPTVAVDGKLVREGIRLAEDVQLSYWDGLILAAARLARCDRILTEDLNHGAVLAGVRIENPFALT